MNLLVYHIASGHAFFTGIGLILFAVAISYWQRPIARRLSGVALIIGLAATAFASAAIGYWYYALLGILLIAWLSSGRWPKYREFAGIPLMIACVGAIAFELPYHFTPRLTPISVGRMSVIGDSVTAGVGDKTVTWPKLLADAHGIEVQDISHVGDTAESALKRLKKVTIDAPLVVVEIGGNDLLGSTTAAQFEVDLDALLEELKTPRRQLVMFELPLPPLYHEYGRVQRQLARKHGVHLIPKRLLLNIIAPKDATLDTIHLSAEGHQQMADLVWQLSAPAYEPHK
jgi:acyl-CoA thioesterase-1